MAKKQKRSNKKGLAFFKLVLLVIIITALLFFVANVLNEVLEKATYNIYYKDEVKESADKYGIDPYLILAVIHCESGGDMNAISGKGAVGLMQIMPSTGEWLAKKVKYNNYTEESLKYPAVNIELGSWYISYLLKKYDNDITLALAAYNAGPGNVDKWLKDEKYSKDGKLNTIPFDETKLYVKKVKNAQSKYLELYEGEFD